MSTPIIDRLQRNVPLVLLCGGLILSISLGVRQSFGLFLTPITTDLSIGRETFAFAMAIQNIIWGLAQPAAGAIADRFGTTRVLLVGTILYMAGLVLMSGATGPLDLHLGSGLFIGVAMSATCFAVILGAVGRLVSEEKRSMALGIASAGGSFGQFIMAPIGQAFINEMGWSQALFAMAILAALMAPLSVILSGNASKTNQQADPHGLLKQSLAEAIREAFAHKGFMLLTLGFFVCGFQVVFIAVHLPAYIQDLGLSPSLGATALALIGFFNILGSLGCGALGGRYRKKYVLSILYVLRSVVIALFLLLPKTEWSVMIFSSAIGLLWLGTVPLTSGLVAQIFGVRYMSTLFGFVFFSHQVGSFLGVWIGGWAYDTTGSYDTVWIATIILGLVAALTHLPISDRSVRTAYATAS